LKVSLLNNSLELIVIGFAFVCARVLLRAASREVSCRCKQLSELPK
jgi:hypothetical protein